MPLITIPTRITTNSKTLIDNIFYNEFESDIISGNIKVGISDHIPQFSIIPNSNDKTSQTNKNIYTRKFRNFDPGKFNDDMSKINWSLSDSCDVNQYTANFIYTIDQILDKYAPLSKISNRQYKQKSKPWINADVLKAIKAKNNIYNKFINEQNETIKNEHHLQFKQLKNDITKQIRYNKKLYYNDYFSKNSQNVRKLWAGINNLVNTKPKQNAMPSCIETKINGKLTIITEPKQISNTFNDHYTTVADNILKTRKYPGNKHFTYYLKDHNSHTFMTKPTTPKEIEDLIKVSDTLKSTGPNSIPNKIIKQISTSVSIPIANICNNSFSTGNYPNVLKISKVIPIHKKDSKLTVSNYRPISLLSNINKIIEKLMFNRLYSFLELHNCIYELQFGFRQKHSTNHALLSMTQEIR